MTALRRVEVARQRDDRRRVELRITVQISARRVDEEGPPNGAVPLAVRQRNAGRSAVGRDDEL